MAEEDTMMQDMMTMMMVIMMIAVLSQVLQVQAAPPMTESVTVTLVNLPAGANKWLMNIIDHSISYYQTSGAKGITEPAVFEVEQGWFPLCIEIRVEGVGGEMIYHIQSFSTTEPDYKDISINAYGVYSFDVSQEAFIVMEVAG